MSSVPPPHHPSPPPRPPANNTLSHAVHAVERVLSFRAATKPRPTPTLAPPSASAAPCPLHTLPLSLQDLSTDEFPTIPDDRLHSLFPSPALEHVRQNVRVALDDMQLDFSLDPKSLANERTPTNQGYHAIALLLSKLDVRTDHAHLHGAHAMSAQLSAPAADDQPDDPESRDSTDRATALHRASTVARLSRAYETHDLLKAIDKRDTETILAIRDANFDLLLDLSSRGSATAKTTTAAAQAGGTSNTPLGYAIGLGKGWEGVSIVLVGALSKFVNTLPDEEEQSVVQPPALTPGEALNSKPTRKAIRVELDPHTMACLRKVRMNLKLAIDHSIFTDQTSLLASYMQVLVMSEGTSFLHNSLSSLHHTLLTHSSDAVTQARSLVLQFVTDALRHKSDRVAAVKDYVANATSDLILMALWDLVKLHPSQVEAEPEVESQADLELRLGLPLYFFARDERITVHFVERIARLEHFLQENKSTQPRGKRNAVWKMAREVVKALEQGNRSKSAQERLDVVAIVVHR